MDQAAGRGAGGDLDTLDESVLAVEAERPEFFDRQARHERLEMREDQFRPVQQGRLARALPQDAAGNLHHRDKLQRLDAPDAFQPAVVGFGPCNEAGQRTGLGDEAGGQREHVHPAAAAAKEHGQKLGVAQRGGPEVLEPLLRAFAHSEVAQAGRRAGAFHTRHNSREIFKSEENSFIARTIECGGVGRLAGWDLSPPVERRSKMAAKSPPDRLPSKLSSRAGRVLPYPPSYQPRPSSA